MTIENLVASALTQNTGTHMCDSGGTDGRGWQQRKGMTAQDFAKEPYVTHDITQYQDGEYEIERTVDVYHHLVENNELDELCKEFNEINFGADDDYVMIDDLYGVNQGAVDFLEHHDYEVIRSWNTYNGESQLSTVLQGAHVEMHGAEYMIVQTHNGADVRGGYSDAFMVKLSDAYENIIEYEDPEYLMENVEYLENVTLHDGATIEDIVKYRDNQNK